MTIGEALKIYRKKNNLLQREVADIIGITQSAISFTERTGKPTSKETYEKIKELIDFKEEDNNYQNFTSQERICNNFKIIGNYIHLARRYSNKKHYNVCNYLKISSCILTNIENGKMSTSAKTEVKALNDLLNYFNEYLIFTDEFRESLNDIKYLIEDSKVFDNKNFNTNHFITFRERLILFLNENNMTSYSLANKLNVSGFVIKALENGKHTIISSINGLDVAIHIGYLNFKNKKEAKEYLRVKFNPIRRYIHNYYKSNRITMAQISSKFNVHKEIVNRLYNKPEENLSDSLINLAVNLVKDIVSKIGKDDELIKIMDDFKIIMINYYPEFYQVQEKSIHNIDKDEVLSDEFIMNVEIDKSEEIIKNIIKQEIVEKGIYMNQETKKELENIIFEGINNEDAYSIKLHLFDAIYKLIESNELELASQYIKFVNNLKLFDVTMLNMKLLTAHNGNREYNCNN